MNNEFETVWKEAVVAEFKVLSQNFNGLRAEILTPDLPKPKQECQPLNRNVPFERIRETDNKIKTMTTFQ
jgi:hypothetical protein